MDVREGGLSWWEKSSFAEEEGVGAGCTAGEFEEVAVGVEGSCVGFGSWGCLGWSKHSWLRLVRVWFDLVN